MSKKNRVMPILFSAVLIASVLALNSCGQSQVSVASSDSTVGESSSQTGTSSKSSEGSISASSTAETSSIEVTLSEIAVTKSPTKTSYVEGETFDSTGMEVTASYSNGSSNLITDYTIDKTTALTISDKKITVSYQGKTATVAITVDYADLTGFDLNFSSSNKKHTFEGDAYSTTVTWAEVKSNEYSYVASKVHSGDLLNKESISITVENKNDSALNLRIDAHSPTKHGDHNCSAINKYEDCDNDKVTTSTDLAYGGSTFVIPALEKATCTVYLDSTLGEMDYIYVFLNSSTYASDASKIVESSGSVVLSDYEANDHIDPYTKSITVTKSPTKTSYVVGDVFDPTGMVISAVLSDKTTAVITGYTYKTEALTAEDTSIEISYVEGTKTFKVTVQITVAASAEEADAENTEAENNDLTNSLTAGSGLTLEEDTTAIQGKGKHSIKVSMTGTYAQAILDLDTTQVANLKTTTFSAYFKWTSGTLRDSKAYEKVQLKFYNGSTSVLASDNLNGYMFQEGKITTGYETLQKEGDWWHVTINVGKVFTEAVTAGTLTDETISTINRMKLQSGYGDNGVVINIDNMTLTH